MATTYTRQLLSGSTNGRMIEVNATSSPGTTIHTVQATATAAREEVIAYAVRGSTATGDQLLTVEFGGTATEDQVVVLVNELDSPSLVIPGVSLTATTSIVRAFATATGLFRIMGWVNRAT